jgi:HAD superfamily hydrolase (TIGR01509 family)
VTIRALLFDFDGTIWDSEVAAFQSWSELYAEHGVEYTLEEYAVRLGTIGGPNPIEELERRVGRALDGESLARRRWERKLELLDTLHPREGVAEYLRSARARGMSLAIVSTDDVVWVTSGLAKLQLDGWWDFIECADGDPARAKPSPVLYESALKRFGLLPHEAIAIEDSPNGILAAKGADLFCFAVSHAVSAQLDLRRADLIVSSLTDISFDELLRLAEEARTSRPHISRR